MPPQYCWAYAFSSLVKSNSDKESQIRLSEMVAREYPIDGISYSQVDQMARKLGVELEVVEELPHQPVGEKHRIILMMTKGIFHAYV